MRYKNRKLWTEIVDINSKDLYSRAVIDYCIKWSKLMENEIEDGKKLEEIAERTSHEADTDGITGFMYGMAVHILSQTWEFGDDLRKWHNKEYGQPDAKGTVNPAILIIEDKEQEASSDC